MRLKKLLAHLLTASFLAGSAHAVDLGAQGQLFEILEEDFRLTIMKLVAKRDWSPSQQELQESAYDYTKNLPSYLFPRAEKTLTRWMDVGVVTSEDIYLPSVDWETGSVFEPKPALAVKAGTYLNPLANLPSAGIERLFIFDATDPDQLSSAKTLIQADIGQLSFMITAGDLGPLSTEVNRPIFHATPDMLEKFRIRAVPTLIGFGVDQHNGHMAITELALPVTPEKVKAAWFGLSSTQLGQMSMPLEESLEKQEEKEPSDEGN